MTIPKSLGLVLATCVLVATARQSISNLRDSCEVTVDHSGYDLCPLFYDRGQSRVLQVHAELGQTTQLHYEISFDGPLNTPSGEGAGPQVRTGEFSAS